MGIAERKEREKEALRERILDAAFELVSAEGVAALTMRRIADRIEYSATALYAHFPDKDALLAELCKREFTGLAREISSFLPTDDPIADLGSLGRAYCRFAVEHPQAYRLMFLLPGMPSRPEKKDESDDAYCACVKGVRRIREKGLLRTDLGDDELIAQTLWAALHGVLALQLVKHDKGIPWHAFEARVEAALRILIDGIRVR